MISGSRQTLTHISLDYPLDDSKDLIPLFQQLWSFPNIHTLSLGLWVNLPTNSDLAYALAKFLHAHPSLRKLSLGWETCSEYCADLPVHVGQKPPTLLDGFLPNLEYIDAHPLAVDYIAKHSPTTLKNLVELRTGVGSDVSAEPYCQSVLTAMEELGGSSVLKRLAALDNDDDNHDRTVEAFRKRMAIFARIFPSLERWEGSFPSDMVEVRSRIIDHRMVLTDK